MAVDLQGHDQLDFSGGMSDLSTEAPPNQVEDLENWDITPEGKPKLRAGTRPIDSDTYAQAATKKLGKINALLNSDTDKILHIRSAAKIYTYDGTTAAPTEVTNQAAASAFTADLALTTASTTRFHKWKNQVFGGAFDYSKDKLFSPVKAFTDESGTGVAINASLPRDSLLDRGYAYMLVQSLLLANDLRVKIREHYQNATAHPAGIQSIVGADDTADHASDLPSLISLTKSLVISFNDHSRDARSLNSLATPSYHQTGAAGGFYFTFGNFHIDVGTYPTTLLECAKLLNKLKVNFGVHINAFSGQGVPNAVTADSRGVASLYHGALTTSVTASAIEISGSNTDGFVLTKAVPESRLYEVLSFIRTAYNAHLGTAGGTGGHVLVDSANYVPSITIDSHESFLLVFWKIYIGYHFHVRSDTPIVHDSALTDPEKLATYSSFGAVGTTSDTGSFTQLLDTGYITMFDLSYSGVDLLEVLTKLADMIDKMAVHVPTSRHSTTGAALTIFGDYFAITALNAGVIQYKLTFKNSYKLTDGTEFIDEGAPFYPFGNGFALVTTFTTSTRSSGAGPAATVYAPITWAIGTVDPAGYGISGVESFPTSTYTKGIYRTVLNGDVFYKVYDDVDPLLDTITDTILATREVLYAESEVSHAQLPKFRTSVLVEDKLYVADIEDNTYQVARQFTWSSGTTLTSVKWTGAGTTSASAHNLSVGDIVYLKSTSALPTGLSASTKYFVKTVPTSSTFTLSTTEGGAAITPSGAGSGKNIFAKYAQNRLKNRVYQALPTTPFFTNENFFADLDHPVKLLGHARGFPIAVCDRGVYRIEGSFDLQGNGSLSAKLISDRVFGIGSVCGITVDNLFFFAALDGIWMTDGYKCTMVTPHLSDSYQANITKDQSTNSLCNEEISCAYNPIENRIYFAMGVDAATEMTQMWVIHLDHLRSLSPPYTFAPFSKYTNASHFYPTVMEFWRGRTIQGTKDGYLFEHEESIATDPRLASSVVLSDGSTELKQYIPFLLTTLANNYGTNSKRKWISRLAILAYNHGNLSIGLRQINDLNSTDAQNLKEIRFRQTYKGIIKERRGFSSGSSGKTFSGLKAMFKQVELSPLSTILHKSDDSATASIVGTALNIDSGGWPTDQYKGDSVYFGPLYATPYVISAQASTTQLTLASAPGNAANQKWIIKGYPRDEFPELIGFTFYGDTVEAQQVAPTGNDGDNA